MPELPELEAIRKYLTSELYGKSITSVETYNHTVIRYPKSNEFINLLQMAVFEKIERIGRMLVFSLHKGDLTFNLFIDHGLTGRLGWETQYTKIPSKTVFVLKINEVGLIYHDKRLHGAVWLYEYSDAKKSNQPSVIENYGPDILDISVDEFKKQIKRKHGEIKNILINQRIVAGLGNAYSDEVLFNARIHPFTKRNQLDELEIERLYNSSKSVLLNAISEIHNFLIETQKLDNEQTWRAKLFKVHLKEGYPCPICGHKISTIKAHHRITNFCRNCQPSKNRNFI